MFKLSKNPTYKWPVKCDVPNNGSFQEVSFTAEFKHVPQNKIDEWADLKGADQAIAVNEFFVGWGNDLVDEEGNQVPFTEENKQHIANIAYVRHGLFKAFYGSVAGRLQKN